jgi:hypothetical protein
MQMGRLGAEEEEGTVVEVSLDSTSEVAAVGEVR